MPTEHRRETWDSLARGLDGSAKTYMGYSENKRMP